MIGGGEFKSSLVQQMVWGDTINSNIKSGLRPCAEEQEESTKMPPLASPNSLFFPHDHHQLLHLSSGQVPEVGSTTTSPANLHGGQEGHMPDSWSQMLLGGLIGDHEGYSSTATALLSKGLEEGPMAQAYNFCGHGAGGGEEIQTSGAKSQSHLSQMLLASSPRSCITGMLDFSNSSVPAPPEARNHRSDNSSESNSTATGSALKKPRVQASSSAQSTLKVRKERLGDRITALHQIVSPFGKTDTASVLQETVGYIRFLLGQIEALSYPYMGHGTGGSMRQQTLLDHSNHENATTEASPTDQDAEDGEEGKKDLRISRGLCLVPVSCTSHLGADSASDFWAPVPVPVPVPVPPPPPPLGGIILR